MPRQYALLLVGGLALASCQKEPTPAPVPEPVAKDFTVSYRFLNQGDARVETLWLQTKTFYPNKYGPSNNALSIHDDTYPNITPTQLVSHAASSEPSLQRAYPGCITYMKVILRFRTPGYTPFPSVVAPSGGYRTRVFELPPDTVTNAANCTRTFTWPADTLTYREMRYY